jgi:hypothetical protein
MDLHVVKDIVVPIIIGVLSSVCFLLLISRLRPRLEISKQIAHIPAHAQGSLPGSYIIKVINKSKRSATEIRGRLAIVQKVNVAGGQINQSTDFTLLTCPFELPGKKRGTPAQLEESAFRFATNDNIETNWTGNNFISFSVVAKDSLTGFGKVFTEGYYAPAGALKTGEFEIGHSMEITPPLKVAAAAAV